MVVILGLMVFLTGASCQREQQGPHPSPQLSVVTTLFPLYDFARQIAGERASVTLLLPPGVEAHSFEPKAGDILRVNKADLFIFTGKFMEPWADSFLKGVDNKSLVIVDTSQGITLMAGEDDHDHGHGKDKDPGEGTHHHRHGRVDPHIWLDFNNAQRMVNTILMALVTKDPGNKDFYLRNADAYMAKLADLDRRYREGLSRCQKKIFVHGGHFVFNYLARRYNLEYISAYSGSPDAEPSPRQLIALKKKIQENDLKVIYHEELIAPRIAEVLAKETGARILKLHGAHNIAKDDFEKGTSFVAIMEENLKRLREGLECQQ